MASICLTFTNDLISYPNQAPCCYRQGKTLPNLNKQSELVSKKESRAIANRTSKRMNQGLSTAPAQLADNRSEFDDQISLAELANHTPQANQIAQLQAMADGYTGYSVNPVQKKPNHTGLPDNLKSGIENLSGYSMDDVKVHFNSGKPAQLQAHAYAQGSEIHLGPGQEKHLPHEAWHVVQQKQGRVRPTLQMKGNIQINDDQGLEKEADEMGEKSLTITHQKKLTNTRQFQTSTGKIIQRNPNEIIKNVAGLLTYGAGNRKSDIDKTEGESVVRVNASKNLGRKNRGNAVDAMDKIKLPQELTPFMKEAISGIMVKAGNCMEHAAIAFFLALKSYPGYDVYIMNAKDLDHAFVLVSKPGKDLEEGLVIDGWQVQDNNKKLKESNWTGSDNYRIKLSGTGVDYITEILQVLEIDQDGIDSAMAKSKHEIDSGAKPFKVYAGL